MAFCRNTILPGSLTGCLSQQSLMAGRIFLCTTTSCRSSREGCWPISSSNGSMYSPTVPGGTPQGYKASHKILSSKRCSVQIVKSLNLLYIYRAAALITPLTWVGRFSPDREKISLFIRSAWSAATSGLWAEQHSCTVWLTVDLWAARHQLPQHQAHGVHVYPQEGVSLEVNGSL